MENFSGRKLEEIFLSTFHNKLSFSDFLNLDVSSEYEKIPLKRRVIYSPSEKLKMIHRFINKTVFDCFDYNKDVVYSYRKGVSTRDAVEKHSNSIFYFHTDIKDFFKFIGYSEVRKAIETKVKLSPASDFLSYIDRIIELVVVDGHIPAGFSTSPILSNVSLSDFDDNIYSFCLNEGLVYTRYSDDIFISSDKDDFFDFIEIKVLKLLREHVNSAISINERKTKFYKRGGNFKILGYVILPNGIVTLPKKEKDDIELMIYFYLTDKDKLEDYFLNNVMHGNALSEGKSTLEHAITKISAKLIAFNSMDKQYVSKLRKKYGNTVIDMFIRKSAR